MFWFNPLYSILAPSIILSSFFFFKWKRSRVELFMTTKLNTKALLQVLDALRVQRAYTLTSLPFSQEGFQTDVQSAGVCAAVSEGELELVDFTSDVVKSALETVREEFRQKVAHQTSPRGADRVAIQNRQLRESLGPALEGRRLLLVNLSGPRRPITASFNRTDMRSSSLDYAYVAYDTFNATHLQGTSAVGTEFYQCTFIGCSARDMIVSRAKFAYCVFIRCDVRGWHVEGTFFHDCSFTHCDLSGWVYDSQTTLIKPIVLEKCRRTNWEPKKGVSAKMCSVNQFPFSPSVGPRQTEPSV
ncbi:hypothetical protein AGDE_07223 [Angomonas deanei]|uniref:Pentapeptide repeats (9 copies), putative n=1 Tax=Angomonas deanei TaxID=59799 RepID=A0A7G2C5I9_9TRYP|nr:hypothetical protein AGDE_07223 [Angomonas deanei]CAD2214424.1 Pentapeptide repeats (9 copies), putative [Angomonas deanei]|eukprot:EPY35819.1 hypothetical protein AGDE_07223 [Angomonas deanei]